MPFDRLRFSNTETFLKITQALHDIGLTDYALCLRSYAWENREDGTVRAVAPPNGLFPYQAFHQPPLVCAERVYLLHPEEGGRD